MPTTHRANYTFEHGVWRASCRCCAFQVVDEDRRRAASQFRLHIREVAEKEADGAADVLDLTVIPPGPGLPMEAGPLPC